jgi:hypothetical protein
MTYFEALPVKGDAFLLVTDEYHLLVDGGGSAPTLAKALSGVPKLDVVICTHADQDHAGGLTKILSMPKAPTIGEFWLPGSWTDYLEEMLLKPDEFAARLGDEIYEIFADGWPDDSAREGEDGEPLPFDLEILQRSQAGADLDARADGIDVVTTEGEARPIPEDDWFTALGSRLQGSRKALFPSADGLAAAIQARTGPSIKPLTTKQEERRRAILVGAIETAERIRQIAIQAIAYKVKVRWFDFGAFKSKRPSGGWPGRIQPVNACELVLPPPKPRVSRAHFIALTTVNLESLVFQALERTGTPSVLFCADSPLTGGRPGPWPGLPQRPSGGMLMTAPHHGRDSNAGAYAIAESWLPRGRRKFTWVRSGGRSLPCDELRRRRRFCTACGLTSSATSMPAAVRLDPSCSPQWGWWAQGLPCGC